MQNPTARFAPDGEMLFGMSSVSPNNRYFITLQALPRLEATVKYTEITNRLYGPASLSGDQTLKDKSFDAKLLLIEEGSVLPQIALGLRDFGGTGLYSSEYIVANRRWYDFDFSFGLGWGYLGSHADIANPLSSFVDSFGTRVKDIGLGGKPGVSSWFHGKRISLFGGIEYQTPIKGLSVKLEYEGNDYQHEPQNNNQIVDSPFNIGAKYKLFDWLDISMALERGNTVMLSAVARTNFNDLSRIPKFDSSPQPLVAKYDYSENIKLPPNPKKGRVLFDKLSENGYMAEAIDVRENTATVALTQGKYREQSRAIGRAARIVFNSDPERIEVFNYVNLEGGLESNQVTLYRQDLENAVNFVGSPEEIWSNAAFIGSEDNFPVGNEVQNYKTYPNFNWGWGPQIRQHMGGPDNFYFWQFWARLSGSVELSRGLTFEGDVGFDIYNNFDALKYPSNSVLPHVRSDIKDYLKEGKNNLVSLELDYVKNLWPDWFGRLSVGIFEEMYGGIEGEILYRPYWKRWAIGANLNWVRKRDFDQRFSFRDYSTATGNLTLYYELPVWNILTKISAGKYLAKDKGMTFDFSRRFDSGVRMGAFLTLTDVPKEEFGEGSFDKGIYVSIPWDYFFTKSTRTHANFGWRPLTRDGGQKVNALKQLYPLTENSRPGPLSRDWHRILE